MPTCYRSRIIFQHASYLLIFIENRTFTFYKITMKEITVLELKKMIDNKEDFQLIDVRETFEYEMSNLNGLNIPLAGVILEASKISKDKPVIMQCRSGARSAAALNQLEQQLGYTNLYNLKGGILAWKAEFEPDMPVY